MKKSSFLALLSLLAVIALPAHAVNRLVSIIAPPEAPPDSTITATVQASTDANDGEQIGFLHAEYSNDDGKTWTQFCYAEKSGVEFSRQVTFPVGAKGTKTVI